MLPTALQKTLFVLALALLAIGPALAFDRLRARAAGPRARRAADLAAGAALAAGALLALAALRALAQGGDEDPFSGYAAYWNVLLRPPPALQGAAGLALVLAAGWPTFHLFFARNPQRRRRAALLAAVAAWCGLYGLLPFHLSSPDFDDFFVLDKLLGGAEAGWGSNKPFFTAYDLLYRVSALFPFVRDRFGAFAVNGWVWVLFTVNVALALQRVAGRLAAERLGAPLAVAALVLGALSPGALVLSHTLSYELAGATFLLLSFNVLERACEPDGAGLRAVFAWLGLALALEATTSDRNCAFWLAALAHGLLAVRRLRPARGPTALAAAVLALGVVLFLGREAPRVRRWAGLLADDPVSAALVGLGLAAGAALVVRLARRPGATRAFAGSLTAGASAGTVAALYLVFTGLLYLLPGRVHFGFPLPGYFGVMWRTGMWGWAANHARSAAPFHPFLALAVGVGLLRLRALRPGAVAALMLAAAVAWGHAYATRFYFARPAERWTQGDRWNRPVLQVSWWRPYARNSRVLESLERALAQSPAQRFAYVPIPRDHGDHYVLRAARPGADVRSVCEPGVLDDPARALVLTSHTWQTVVWVAEDALAQPHAPLFGAEPAGLSDTDWAARLLPLPSLDRRKVAAWCAVARPELRLSGGDRGRG